MPRSALVHHQLSRSLSKRLGAQATGRDRFGAFVERARQQLASGRFGLVPEERR
jgi:hypothetical protein